MKRYIPIAIVAAMFVAFVYANTQLCRLMLHRPWRTPTTAFADTFRASDTSRGWPIEPVIWIYTTPETPKASERLMKFQCFSWRAGSWIVKDAWHDPLIGFIILINLLVAYFTFVGVHNFAVTLLSKPCWSLRSMLITSVTFGVTIALLNEAAVNPVAIGGLYGGLTHQLPLRYAAYMTLNAGFFVAVVWWSSTTGTRVFRRCTTSETHVG